ncbi:MAG: site-specific DNA-methyltransferase [Thaumarchaeota archaeon]|nr:site-specific DNA-methyltransferase [Nitrososphaerota archaeon]
MVETSSDVKQDAKHKVSPKNNLNELTGKEWIQETCSVFYQKGLGFNHKETKFEKQHPAPFSFQDVGRLIRFFTKENETVLDPFNGVASTLKACAILNRKGIGIELSSRWVKLGKQRLEEEVTISKNQKIIEGDSRIVLKNFKENSISYIVTSPPYWNILAKQTAENKRKSRSEVGLATKYSTSSFDLGNIVDYSQFLAELGLCFKECFRVLQNKRYTSIIVSDFRHKSELVPFHSHVSDLCTKIGFTLQGIGILVQRNKKLYPYGYPYAYVPNIHHQYVLTFRKL